MSLIDDIQKQPRHVREVMFGLCVVITIALVGMVWFRSFEENIFVLINPDKEKQDLFFAERDKRVPVVYANVMNALGNMRAAVYDSLGLLEEMDSNEIVVEEELEGEVRKLPLSGDRE